MPRYVHIDDMIRARHAKIYADDAVSPRCLRRARQGRLPAMFYFPLIYAALSRRLFDLLLFATPCHATAMRYELFRR